MARELLDDWSDGPPANWGNQTLPDYLEALVAWLIDSDGYYARRKRQFRGAVGSWSQLHCGQPPFTSSCTGKRARSYEAGEHRKEDPFVWAGVWITLAAAAMAFEELLVEPSRHPDYSPRPGSLAGTVIGESVKPAVKLGLTRFRSEMDTPQWPGNLVVPVAIHAGKSLVRGLA
ncbi:DUF7660 family protein [Amycolatopsis pigmentata]|uniref:DUF7660 domain-containing protein n=1 Tax=Amycolatopsis pigmentata TaxID=450801 RepID=A0ABW5FY27_9PSEU